MSESTHAIVGERASYVETGKAMRQAVERAVMLGDELSRGNLRVLAAVLAATTSYSKLTDRVSLAIVAVKANVSVKQTGRSLRRLAEAGVVVFVPGLGAGNLSVVGVPPEGVKADEYLSALGLRSLVRKGDRTAPRKGTPTRTRGDLGDLEEEERSSNRREVVGGVRRACEAQADGNGSEPTLFETDQLRKHRGAYGDEP